MNNKLYLLAMLGVLLPRTVMALELLDLPAAANKNADHSVLLAMLSDQAGVTLVGERGHILHYDGNNKWQQSLPPTSVTLTDIAQFSDGSQVVIGHDGVILTRSNNQSPWQTRFDGYELIRNNQQLLAQRIEHLQQTLQKSTEQTQRDDLTFAIEDLQFAQEDSAAELVNGPNKPLLSMVTLADDSVFVVGAYGTLLHSADRGQQWQLISDRLDNPSNFHLNAITKDRHDNLYIVGENATAFASYDKGQSWQVMELDYHGSFFGINADQQSDSLIAYGLQGHISISNDSGQHWQQLVQQAPTSLLGGTIVNNQAYLVGQGGIVATFSLSTPQQMSIHKHPSGAIFSDVIVKDQTLLLCGQHGFSRWPLTQL